MYNPMLSDYLNMQEIWDHKHLFSGQWSPEINNSSIYDSVLMKIIQYDQKQALKNSQDFDSR